MTTELPDTRELEKRIQRLENAFKDVMAKINELSGEIHVIDTRLSHGHKLNGEVTAGLAKELDRVAMDRDVNAR